MSGAGSDAGRPPSDRRGEVRIPLEMWVQETSEDGTYFQRAGNLSSGGMFLDRTIPHPVGTRVNLKFNLPDDPTPLQVTAEIVFARTTELGMGLRFLELSPENAERIRRFVEARRGP